VGRAARTRLFVDQPDLRSVGLHAVSVLRTTANLAVFRLQFVDPSGLSVYELTLRETSGRILSPDTSGSMLHFVLDCFLLALLYDMCVGNVP
jgi:hypothetical protein